jgi:hypothetical protein
MPFPYTLPWNDNPSGDNNEGEGGGSNMWSFQREKPHVGFIATLRVHGLIKELIILVWNYKVSSWLASHGFFS